MVGDEILPELSRALRSRHLRHRLDGGHALAG
jgi:hypothetical protein